MLLVVVLVEVKMGAMIMMDAIECNSKMVLILEGQAVVVMAAAPLAVATATAVMAVAIIVVAMAVVMAVAIVAVIVVAMAVVMAVVLAAVMVVVMVVAIIVLQAVLSAVTTGLLNSHTPGHHCIHRNYPIASKVMIDTKLDPNLVLT